MIVALALLGYAALLLTAALQGYRVPIRNGVLPLVFARWEELAGRSRTIRAMLASSRRRLPVYVQAYMQSGAGAIALSFRISRRPGGDARLVGWPATPCEDHCGVAVGPDPVVRPAIADVLAAVIGEAGRCGRTAAAASAAMVSAVITVCGHCPARSARVMRVRSGTRASSTARSRMPLRAITEPSGAMMALAPVVEA